MKYLQEFIDLEPICFTDDFRDDKLQEINWCLENINIPGVVVEAGVWRGYSVNHIAKHHTQVDKTVYGFDSNVGLPHEWRVGDFYIPAHFHFSGQRFEPNVKFYEGWFEDTFPRFKEDVESNISFLNIDSDVYSSAMDALEILNDRIVEGTIIRFDELCCWRTVTNNWKEVEWVNNRALPAYTNWPEHEFKALIDWTNKYNRKVRPISRTGIVSGCVYVES